LPIPHRPDIRSVKAPADAQQEDDVKFEEFQSHFEGPLTPDGAKALEEKKLETGKTWKEFAEPFGLAGTTLNNLVNHHSQTPHPISASHGTAKKLWSVLFQGAQPEPVRPVSPEREREPTLEELARIARRKGFRVTFEQII
jgi:hypothetical protein